MLPSHRRLPASLHILMVTLACVVLGTGWTTPYQAQAAGRIRQQAGHTTSPIKWRKTTSSRLGLGEKQRGQADRTKRKLAALSAAHPDVSFVIDTASSGVAVARNGGKTTVTMNPYVKVEDIDSAIAGNGETERQRAIKYIRSQRFEAKSTGKWASPHLSWAKVQQGAIMRIEDPTSLDYGDGIWVCGPAAVMHAVLERGPMEYAKRVVEAFSEGTWNGQRITAEMLAKAPGASNAKHFAVDYVALTGFKNTHRNFTRLPFVGESFAHPAQWNLPGQVARWLKRVVGYRYAKSTFLLGDQNTKQTFIKSLDEVNAFLPETHTPGGPTVILLANPGNFWREDTLSKAGEKSLQAATKRSNAKAKDKASKPRGILQRIQDFFMTKGKILFLGGRPSPEHYIHVVSKIKYDEATQRYSLSYFSHGKIVDENLTPTQLTQGIYAWVRGWGGDAEEIAAIPEQAAPEKP